ncbi:MAG: questin oxidase family protein [Pseudomonadota bacterium]
MPATALPPATLAELHVALDTSLAYAATYPVRHLRLSNHLPMVLSALYRLQAPAASLDALVKLHVQRLEALPPDALEATLTGEVADEIRHTDVATMLARRLPGLLEASETAAFHGLIRLAHALDTGHAGEITRALAAWQAQRHSLGTVPEPDGGRTLLHETLGRVAADPALAFTPREGTLITDDMQRAAALPGFAAAVSGPEAPTDDALTLDALAEASLAVYLASRDFTALHLVTGCHALRQVLPHARLGAETQRRILRGVWRAWLAAWVSIGRPRPDWAAVRAGAASEADWAGAIPLLAASRDDHRIKLAWSALDEWRHRGWPGYARVLQSATAEVAA